MHNQRSLIRVITRILYAGGFIFIIVGLLLSALSSSVFAAGTLPLDLTWTDTPPGPYIVYKLSPIISRPVMPPPIGVTPIRPFVIPSFTPTATKILPVEIPSFTPTAKATLTPPPSVIPSFTPAATETQPVEIPSFTPTVTVTLLSKALTPTVARTIRPNVTSSFIPTTTDSRANMPTTTLTAQPGFIGTPTSAATNIVTLAPPARTITSVPVLIPVTGLDLTRPIGANSLSIFGSLITNIGLFSLGLALALTGISSQVKN